MRPRLRSPVLLLLAACSSGPDAPPPVLELPPWDATAEDLTQWWLRFSDPQLDALIGHVLEHNRDLAIAAARVDEAAALVRSTDDLLPDGAVRVGASRIQTSDNNAFPRFAGINRRNAAHSITLDVTWELDLWGRIRAGNRAALADLMADQQALHGLQAALTAQAAQTYFRLVAIDRKLELTTQTQQNREAALRIQERRRQAGTGSLLEVRQAEAELVAVTATLPGLRQAQARTERALLLLAGDSPRAIVERVAPRTSALPEPPPIPAGLPSDLLTRRPDVRQAEAELAAANARVTEAQARYFPTIRLTGIAGQESKELSDLFLGSSTIWSLTAGLVQPLFGLRQIDAEADAAAARAAAAEAGYVRAAQAAFAEVLDALDARTASQQTLAAQTRHIEVLRDQERIARVRHDAGAGAFFELLDARRNLLEVESDSIDTRADRLVSTIDVYRALGGGWPLPVPEEKPAAEPPTK